jgi:hypothetical protein
MMNSNTTGSVSWLLPADADVHHGAVAVHEEELLLLEFSRYV